MRKIDSISERWPSISHHNAATDSCTSKGSLVKLFATCRVLAIATGVSMIFGALSVAAFAAEARCGDLGINCICSEPLQMTALTQVNTSWWNPNDSVTKECNGENVPPGGGAISRNSNDLAPSSLSTILNALPAGHAIARVLKGADGHVGILQIGHLLSSSDPHQRVALRWYMYFSPDFQFKFEGGCENTKIGEIGDTPGGIHFDISVNAQVYGFVQAWSPALDCCNVGPGGDVVTSPAQWKGKWWRLEIIAGNMTGSPGAYLVMYRKNVTDNLPEEKIIDTRVPGGSWTTQAATQLTPPNRVDTLYANQYRQGTCNGYNAWSHVLKAAWSSDAGQRIGPAIEVEGGNSPPAASAPSAPSAPSLR